MTPEIHFIGGPIDGHSMPAAQLDGSSMYTDLDSGAVYYRINGGRFSFSHTGTPSPGNPLAIMGPLAEVTIHGNKLMTLGQIQQFVDAARAAGYPEDQVPRVVNSFSGRIRALTAKN